MTNFEELIDKNIFPLGDEIPELQEYFVGKPYLEKLVDDPDNFDVGVGHVTFEPGSRNNWHTHIEGYQIIIATGGTGWYQEKGEAAQKLVPGDVIAVPEGVNHWHGATKDSWFSHLAVTKGTTGWYEEVSDEEYEKII